MQNKKNWNKNSFREKKNSFKYSKRPIDSATLKTPSQQMDLSQNSSRYSLMGIRPLEEALRKNIVFNKLYLQKSLAEKKFDDYIDYCKKRGIQYSFVEKSILDNKSNYHNHQGVLAELKQDTRIIEDLDNFLKKIFNNQNGKDNINNSNESNEKKSKILILDRLTDQQNVGAITRTAYFFGCDIIICEKSHSAPIDMIVHKISSGASLMVAFHFAEKLSQAINTLKKYGYEILMSSLEEDDSTALESITQTSNKFALIIGSEGSGIRPHIEKFADKKITIPSWNNFDSLNVSVATGILLYALSNTHNHARKKPKNSLPTKDK